MKLHLSAAPGLNLIASYGEDYVQIDNTRHSGSLVVLPERLVPDWPVAGFEQLERKHLNGLLEFRPVLVLLGTGRRYRFVHPDLYRDLIAAGIGLEAMDTGAACRTYNILAAEGRAVAAALIIEG